MHPSEPAPARASSALAGVRVRPPDGAFYCFVDVSQHGESLELAQRILDRVKVITIPGEAFGPGGAGYLRLSYAAPRATIREALERIAGCLGGG